MLREMSLSDFASLSDRLVNRSSNSHKGSFGHALLIGGAKGMCGAIGIAGMSCLRAGAGLVTIAVPRFSLDVVASYSPCYMTVPLDCDDSGMLTRNSLEPLGPYLNKANCVAIGPGLGRSDESDSFVQTLLEQNRSRRDSEQKLPLVLDADALNALSGSLHRLDNQRVSQWKNLQTGDFVMTPHPGEWERWTGISPQNRDRQIEAANQLAAEWNAVIVLKGNRTWVTDGRVGYTNLTGNPSLATGGSGDCLTGIIAALVCQGLSLFESAVLGVHLHGLAGDIAHHEIGTPSTLPTDLIHWLPAAFRAMRHS